MRSEEVHKALIHGATKFELCQLVFRGVRRACKSTGPTPRETIGIVLQSLATDPAATHQYRYSCMHPGPFEDGAHVLA